MRATLASIALVPWFLLDPAFAQTTTRQIAIVQSPTDVDITTPTDTVLVIESDGVITRYDEPASPYFRFLPPSGPNELRIAVAANAHNAFINPNVVVGKDNPYKVTLNIRASRHARVSTVKLYWFDMQIVRKLQNSLADALAALATQKAEYEQRLATQREESDRQLKDNSMRTVLKALGDGYVSTTLSTQPSECNNPDGPNEVTICGLQWVNMGDTGVFRFEMTSTGPRKYDGLRILDKADQDHAAWVSINGSDPVRADQLRMDLKPLERVEVAVIVTNPDPLEKGMRAAFNRPQVMADWKVVDLRPPRREPAEGSGRITIRVQPSIGAVWLANPVNKDELDATTLLGLGIRTSYAFHTVVSVEAELAGIQSNDASFRDIPFEGTTGDMLRSTNGARLLFGGALRLGEKYQPFLRLGFGAQVVDHDVRFVSGQNTTTGPGDGLSFAPLGWFGAGLDIQLSNHWTAGAHFSSIVGGAGATSAEGGIHLGFGWGGHARD